MSAMPTNAVTTVVLVLAAFSLSFPSGSSSAAAVNTQASLANITTSRVTAKGYSDVLAMSMFFYEAQKSGPRKAASDVSGITVNWRGDALTRGDKGMSGGYFDAGDLVKFSLPMGFTMTTLAWGVLEFPQGYKSAGQMRAILAHLKHGADYIMKSYNEREKKLLVLLGDPFEDHARWVSPEVLDEMNIERKQYFATPRTPGTEVACEFAAALAATAEVFSRHRGALPKRISQNYINKLTRKAKVLYDFGERYQGNYTKAAPVITDFYNSFSGYKDELAWGAAWLAVRTGDAVWKTKAAKYYNAPGPGWVMNWDDKSYGVSYLMYDLFGASSSMGATAKRAIESDLDFWMNRVPRLDGQLRILAKWGSNRYAATEAFLSMVWHKRTKSTKYFDFAKSQIDYMLGDNPDRFSYVVGFGSKYPQYPHHRAAHGSFSDDMNSPKQTRHILYGALVGGHRDASGRKYFDKRSDFISNEVACDYNAGLSGALAGLISKRSEGRGKSVPRERVGKEIAVASATKRSSNSANIKMRVRQMTSWPPRRVALTARYYLSMGDLSAKQVKVKLNSGSNSVKVKNSLSGSSKSRYVEIYWPANNAPFPGTASQSESTVSFTVSSTTANWNGRSKDYSNGSGKIPVYQGGKLLGGNPPGGAGPPPRRPPKKSPKARPAPKKTWKPRAPPKKTPKPKSTPRKSPPRNSGGPSGPPVGPVRFKVSSEWPGGFVADVAGGKAGSRIEIRFRDNVDIEGWWNAELLVSEPHQYVFRTMDGNAFGFQASMDGTKAPKPSSLRLK